MIDEASVTVWTTVGNITELIFEFYALRSRVSRVLVSDLLHLLTDGF